MENLNQELEEVVLEIENILLDPNNPRFFSERKRKVGESRICDDKIQADAARRMGNYGLENLKNSIQSNGFLKLDRVIVRPVQCGDNSKYVVVEGNRRIASVKELLSEYDIGEVELTVDVLASLKAFPVLVYRGTEDQIAWILQGIRHVQGIRGWGGYQQAKLLVDQMPDPTNLDSLSDIAKRFGIDSRVANRFVLSYHAQKQLSEDARFKDKLESRKFAMFSEAIFLPGRGKHLRNWLGWTDDALKFENDDALESFAELILPSENGADPKVSRAIDLRDQVSRLLNQEIPEGEEILTRVVTDSEYSLESAMADWHRRFDRRQPEREMDEIIREITDFASRLDAPIMQVPDKAPDLEAALKTLNKKIKTMLRLVATLTKKP
jgi:hypothetical protein